MNIFNPNIFANKLSKIPFKSLQKNGISFLVFDKDNTLSLTNKDEFYSLEIKETINNCINIFGLNSIAILSNSIGKKNSTEKEMIFFDNTLPIIQYERKKPFNFQEVHKYFSETNSNYKKLNSKICFIGDRLMTDIFMANFNHCLSIYVFPLERTHENIKIKSIRYLEDYFLKNIFQNRKINKNFPQLCRNYI